MHLFTITCRKIKIKCIYEDSIDVSFFFGLNKNNWVFEKSILSFKVHKRLKLQKKIEKLIVEQTQ